jgi:hypothetical protein
LNQRKTQWSWLKRVKLSDIATTWKQWELLFRGTGNYQPRHATTYVSRAREVGLAARVTRQPKEVREFSCDTSGESRQARGAKAASTLNTVKEMCSKRLKGKYMRFFVREKKDVTSWQPSQYCKTSHYTRWTQGV